jgi:hypothetical protein
MIGFYTYPDAVGELNLFHFCEEDNAGRRVAKEERLVFANGTSSSQLPTRSKLIAAAVRICCKCVFASPI